MEHDEALKKFTKLRQDIIARALDGGISEKELFQPRISHVEKISFPLILSRLPSEKKFLIEKRVERIQNTGSARAAQFFYDVTKKIAKFCSIVLVIAGEFNYQSYSILVNDLGFDELIRKLKLTVLFIGGPNISVRNQEVKNSKDSREINPILYLAEKRAVRLFLKKQKREVGHFVVGAYTDVVALQEDPHLEYQDWNTNLYYNDLMKCNSLRNRFHITMRATETFLWDSNLHSIRDRLMTMEELKGSGLQR